MGNLEEVEPLTRRAHHEQEHGGRAPPHLGIRIPDPRNDQELTTELTTVRRGDTGFNLILNI
jgi:hypothetical protein